MATTGRSELQSAASGIGVAVVTICSSWIALFSTLKSATASPPAATLTPLVRGA